MSYVGTKCESETSIYTMSGREGGGTWEAKVAGHVTCWKHLTERLNSC